jgi:cellulose synthase/poly-beta-1,6-N-acetylglucosamine synthase-like glycosyltransferase
VPGALEGLALYAALALLAYGMLGYPALALLRARLWPRPWRQGRCRPHISVVIAARDERAHLGAKLDSLYDQCYPQERVEIIVVSDGSHDGTGELVRRRQAAPHEPRRLRLVELPEPRGKAVALNAGVSLCRGELVVFTDARQRLDRSALSRLAENFADPRVGAAGGVIELRARDGALGLERGLSFYGRLEAALRQAESLTRSTVGLAGALYAVRRDLCRSFPAGLVLDDVWQPLAVAEQGFRVVVDPRAVAHDLASPSPKREMARRVRTLAGHYQLVALAPWILWPPTSPLWFELVSHKFTRLLAPLAVVVALLEGLRLGHDFALGRLVVGALIFGVALAVAAGSPALAQVPWLAAMASAARTFFALVWAGALAPWRLLAGADRLWQRTGSEPESSGQSVQGGAA